MRVWLEIQRESGLEKRPLTARGTHGESAKPCPGCGIAPLMVRGTNPTLLPDDKTIRSGGVAMCCGDSVGYMFARPDTLFGLREDSVMLNGRCRVY